VPDRAVICIFKVHLLTLRFLQSSWFPVLLGLVIAGVIAGKLIQGSSLVAAIHSAPVFDEYSLWQPPDANDIPNDETGDRIRYGRDLIQQTSFYLGPKGIVASKSNGMNCQNCHLDAGLRNFANPFCAVCANYPKYRDRSGRVESIEFRVNECMERSLDGKPLDSLSAEMRAMVAYIRWVGEGVPKGVRPKGAAIEELPYLNRPADPDKGRVLYLQHCQSCHGAEGQGALSADSFSYTYPPLWGPHSYASSAGMYRLSRLAGFIKNNMPLGTTRTNPRPGTWRHTSIRTIGRRSRLLTTGPMCPKNLWIIRLVLLPMLFRSGNISTDRLNQ
jgi:thiosulfate dehydrogenase